MKDGVILINNSRGGLIVEKDLADVLNCGKVYSAGLDVASTESIKAFLGGDAVNIRATIYTPLRQSHEKFRMPVNGNIFTDISYSYAFLKL